MTGIKRDPLAMVLAIRSGRAIGHRGGPLVRPGSDIVSPCSSEEANVDEERRAVGKEKADDHADEEGLCAYVAQPVSGGAFFIASGVPKAHKGYSTYTSISVSSSRPE